MRLICIGLAAFALASCATNSMPPPTVPSVVRVGVVDEKVMLAAEGVFQTTLIAANAGVVSGFLQGKDAARVRVVLGNAYTVLLQARKAYEKGDQITALARLVDFDKAISEAKRLMANERRV